VTEKATHLLLSSNLALGLWWYAVKHAVYILNRQAVVQKRVIPYELFYQRKVDISYFKIFGSPGIAIYPAPKTKKTKFSNKGKKAIFLGYPTCSRGYLVYFPKFNVIRDVRTMKFIEQDLLETSKQRESYNTLRKQYDNIFIPPVKVHLIKTRELKRLRRIDINTPPKTYSDIFKFDKDIEEAWKTAYLKEVSCLEQLGGLKPVICNIPSKDLIRLREVYVIKIDQITQNKKYRVRICARGDLLNYKVPK